MAALTAALLGLSAISSAAGQRNQGNYQAGQLDVNAGLADAQAKDAVMRGNEAAARSGLATRSLLGDQRVSAASQGIATDTGSAANIQSDTAAMGELDRLTIQHNARRQAYGYQMDAANARAQAGAVRQATSNAVRGTLLTAASNIWAMRPQSEAPSGMTLPSFGALPAIQQTYNAGNSLASNNYAGIKIRQPRLPGR